jgi:hypothetical protein
MGNGPIRSRKVIVVGWSERVEINAYRASNSGIDSGDRRGTSTLGTTASNEVEQQCCEVENRWIHDGAGEGGIQWFQS